VSHAIELWEMIGDERTIFTAACLSCGWVGGDTRHRLDALVEGRRHEDGLREPWQMAPGEHSGWDGDPRSRPAN
jgi:hypothetical protein